MNVPKNVTRLKKSYFIRKKTNVSPDETFRVYKDDDGLILNCQLSVLGIRAR